MRVPMSVGAVACLILVAATPQARDELTDPTRSFVEGYDPSDNDFFANTPERTVLLRIRMDFDHDGIEDLALSESSTWGNAGGQWLLFRGQPDRGYVYWGTLFFSSGAAAIRALEPGTSELALYVRVSVSRGTLATYRLSGAGLSRLSEVALDLEHPDDRARYDASLRSAPPLPVEYCKLLEYRRDPTGCWRPGLGLR